MITIIYSTHKDENYNSKFKSHLIKSVGLKNVQILEYVNHNEFPLSIVYNKGISEAKYDIIVCCHNDIKLESGWGKKLLKDFSKNPEFGIIGKAGSCYFPSSGVYWEKMNQTMVGQVYHEPKGQKKWLSKYSNKFEFLMPVVTIDGLFISFNRNKIKHLFDESIPGFHFYDHAFCLPNYLDNVKIGVTTSFDITHESVGMVGDDFHVTKLIFLKKYGVHLPQDLKPNEFVCEKTTPKKIKTNDKVAIIIPTKGLTSMLFQCLDSFYEHCHSDNFHIFIGDTGSTPKELDEIESYINNKNNITLIKYDWYQYSKTNNTIVKDNISNEYTYLLFCNNDIKIMNDVIYKMSEVFRTNTKTGTVGCRLYFEDNTLQHNSMIIYHRKDMNLFIPTHEFFGSYYRSTTGKKNCLGNTAALMMIKKKTFDLLGGFDENYLYHFEDVDLNLKCKMIGLTNIFEGTAVAYHYESMSKKVEGKREDLEKKDTFLLNKKINENLKLLQNDILVLQ
jgi:GT2 family glycosyltransferase